LRDAYRSFRELEAREVEGRDWSREYIPRGSATLVMAPHGGWIEPYTTELARAVAGGDLSFYTFQGLSEDRHGSRGTSLHITSHRFDEPVALEAVARARRVLAIHGERSRDGAFVMVGGGSRRLRQALARKLEEAGFGLREPRRGLAGVDPRNLCNRGREGGGAQLELSEALRKRLRGSPEDRRSFVRAVRRVLLEF
jgi:phage replication-related protein YjqB (UPF0714/DUF867 family)